MLPPRTVADPAALARFRREATALAALDHPNVVRALDCDDGLHFLAMEWADGETFDDLVRGGPLPIATAVGLAAQAAAGLDHSHRAGWVHRDVKPANLLVTRAGQVKVLDLGLARVFAGDDDGLTARHDPGAVMGTVDYIAPEQTPDSSGVGHRADVYALGATLYFLLAGRPPFPDGTPAHKLLARQLRDPVPVQHLRPDVPDGVAAVVTRMMARDPAARYPSLADVIRDLDAPPVPARDVPDLSAADPEGASPTVAPGETPLEIIPEPAPAPRHRLPWGVLAVAGAVLVAGAATIWYASRPPSDTRPADAERDAGVAAPTRAGPPADPELMLVREGDRVRVLFAGQAIATYSPGDQRVPQPYLSHVQITGGRVVAEPPEGGVQIGHFPGASFWVPHQSAVQNRAGKFRLTRAGGVEVSGGAIRDALSYGPPVRPGAARVDETRVIAFARRPGGVLVRWSSEVSASASSTVSLGSELNGFCVRLAKVPKSRPCEFRTPGDRGSVLSPAPATWIEAAVTEGTRWGAVLVPHPDNPVASAVSGKLDSFTPRLRAAVRVRGGRPKTRPRSSSPAARCDYGTGCSSSTPPQPRLSTRRACSGTTSGPSDPGRPCRSKLHPLRGPPLGCRLGSALRFARPVRAGSVPPPEDCPGGSTASPTSFTTRADKFRTAARGGSRGRAAKPPQCACSGNGMNRKYGCGLA